MYKHAQVVGNIEKQSIMFSKISQLDTNGCHYVWQRFAATSKLTRVFNVVIGQSMN